MNREVRYFNDLLEESWSYFLQNLPAIVMAVLVFFVGFFTIKYVSKLASNIIDQKSNDPLISDFIINIISFILMLLLVMICMSILGWGSITDKILAGAGIGTFVIGFALKDIGENFLAGILMAFKRPFRVGDLIEVESIKGKVTKMSLRETTIKTLDGKDVFVPNAMILKNPLQNYTLDNYLREDFTINLGYEGDTEALLHIIEEAVAGVQMVQKTPPPSVYIESISANVMTICVRYWINTMELSLPAERLRSQLMLRVCNTLSDKGYKLS